MNYKPFSTNIYKINTTKLKLYSTLSFKSKTQRNQNKTVNQTLIPKNQKPNQTSFIYQPNQNSNTKQIVFKVTNKSTDHYNLKMPLIYIKNPKNQSFNKSILMLHNVLEKKKQNFTKINNILQGNKKLFLKRQGISSLHTGRNEKVNISKPQISQKPNKTLPNATFIQMDNCNNTNKLNVNIVREQRNQDKEEIIKIKTSFYSDTKSNVTEGGELSLDEVKDIIKCYCFDNTEQCDYLFYKDDYKDYTKTKREKYINYFFPDNKSK